MRIVWWGTYDTSKPRTRILLDGLSSTGVEIVQIHSSVWEHVRDKSAERSYLTILARGLRWLFAYPWLIARYLAAAEHDAVMVGYLGQVDAIVLWPFARLRGKPIILDAFISLYNTTVEDRQLFSSSHPLARMIKAIEFLACSCADRVLLDTSAHADYFATTYRLPRSHFGVVYVGAEKLFFQTKRRSPPQRSRQRPRLLFYGQFISLHGIETIVAAAASERGRAYDWLIVGEGQNAEHVDALLRTLELPHVSRLRWIEYENLVDAIVEADLGLGIFGTGQKAAMVIPNKVFQMLAAGERFVTRDSPAMRELLGTSEAGVALVAPADPEALLDGVERLLASAEDNLPSQQVRELITPAAIGQSLKAELQALLAERGRAQV